MDTFNIDQDTNTIRPIQAYDNTYPETPPFRKGYLKFLFSSPSFRCVFFGTAIPALIAAGLAVDAFADKTKAETPTEQMDAPNP